MLCKNTLPLLPLTGLAVGYFVVLYYEHGDNSESEAAIRRFETTGPRA